MTSLYRYYDDAGRLLYVGIANNPLDRQSQHRSASPWFKQAARQRLEHFDSRAEALLQQRQMPFAMRCRCTTGLRRCQRGRRRHWPSGDDAELGRIEGSCANSARSKPSGKG